MMKKLFLLVLLTVFAVSSFSQAKHFPKCPLCRYSKDYNDKRAKAVATEHCGCPACNEIKQKETAARRAEDKRREEAQTAKFKADLAAKKKAEAAERARKAAEEKARIKASEVVINGEVPETNKKPLTKVELGDQRTQLISGKDHSGSTLYSRQIGKWAYLLSETGDTVLKSTAFDVSSQSWEGLNSGSNIFSFTYDAKKHGLPKNIAIVRFILGQQKSDYATYVDYSYNLVNSKGKKLVEDDKKISCIKYCGDDFFMLFTCSPENDCRMVGDLGYSQSGYQMILYDARLDKKYLYSAKKDLPNCKINRSVGVVAERITDKEKTNVGVQGLFRFAIPSCTHTADENGWMIYTDEYIEVGTDRVPKKIFTKSGRQGAVAKYAHD